MVEKIITEEKPGLDLKNATLKDVLEVKTQKLLFDTFGSKKSVMEVPSEFRGLAFEFNGQKFAGVDGIGMDEPFKYANTIIDQQMDENTSMLSIIEEILEDSTGKDFTQEEIIALIKDGTIDNLQLSLSTSKTGIPTGWGEKIALLEEGTHVIEKTVMVEEWIPPHTEIIQEYIGPRRVLNPYAVAAEVALETSAIADVNDVLRDTVSQDSKTRRLRDLIHVARSNDKKEKTTPEQPKPRRNIHSFQRNTKKSPGKRYFEHPTTEITEFQGFTGTKRGDMITKKERRTRNYSHKWNENAIKGFAEEEAQMNDEYDR